MSASVHNSNRTVLLILPRQREIYALSTDAFTQGQSVGVTLAPTRKGMRRRLAKKLRDALILDIDGTLRGIEHIDVLGLIGDNLARRLFSWITQYWRLEVRLSEPLQWPLPRLTQLIADCIRAHGLEDQDDLTLRESLAVAILGCSKTQEILAVLNLPPPEDALDVL
jgi:hypothetical protein